MWIQASRAGYPACGTGKGRGKNLVAEGVLNTASKQEEEDSERDEEGLQAAIDAQGLDEEAERQDAPQGKHHLVCAH